MTRQPTYDELCKARFMLRSHLSNRRQIRVSWRALSTLAFTDRDIGLPRCPLNGLFQTLHDWFNRQDNPLIPEHL